MRCPRCGKNLILERNLNESEDRLLCLCGWSITRREAENMKDPGSSSQMNPETGDPNNEKRCSKCKISKPLDRFTKNSSTPDGLDYLCKVCKSDVQWKSRQLKKDKHSGRKARKPRILRPGDPIEIIPTKIHRTKTDPLMARSPEQIVRMLQHGTALGIAAELRAFADQLETKYA